MDIELKYETCSSSLNKHTLDLPKQPAKKRVKLFSVSAFIFLCRVGGAGFTFLIQVLLARWMGAEQLGVFVFVQAILIILSQVITLGYPLAAFRFIGQYLAKNELAPVRGFLRQSLWVILGVSLLLYCIVIPLLWLVREWLPEERVIPLILIVLGAPVWALMERSHKIAHVYSWFKIGFLPDLLLPLLFLIAVAGLWYAKIQLTAAGVIIVYLAVLFVVTSSQYFSLRRMLKFKLGYGRAEYHTQEWYRVSSQVLVSVLFAVYFPQVFIIIIGLFISSEQLAIFNVSYRVVLLIEFGLAAVFAVVMPKLSPALVQGKVQLAQRLISQASLLMFWSAAACGVILTIYGREILSFFGEEFIVGYEALLILVAVQLVNASLGPVAGLLTNFGYQDRCLWVLVWGFTLTAGLSIVLVPHMGITGAAVCVLIMTVFSAIWMHWLVIKYLGIRPSIWVAMMGVFQRT